MKMAHAFNSVVPDPDEVDFKALWAWSKEQAELRREPFKVKAEMAEEAGRQGISLDGVVVIPSPEAVSPLTDEIIASGQPASDLAAVCREAFRLYGAKTSCLWWAEYFRALGCGPDLIERHTQRAEAFDGHLKRLASTYPQHWTGS